MSSGAFINSFYELNGGGFARIRVQPETELLTDGTLSNDSGAGPATIPVAAKVSRGNREIGIQPRRFGVKFELGQAPTGYKADSVFYLPCLTRAFFDAVEIGQELTYGTIGTITVVGKLEENIR